VIGGKYRHPQIFDGFSLPPGTHSPVAVTDSLRSTVTVAAVAPVVSLAAVAAGAWLRARRRRGALDHLIRPQAA